MCADDGAYFVRTAVAMVKEDSGGGEQGLEGVEQLTMSGLRPKLVPEHLDRIDPQPV